MTVIDLTHFLSESMPVYPGTKPPRIVEANTVAENGFAEKLLSLYSHTGTHIDAPGHILPGAATLDDLEIGHFLGPGLVVDVSHMAGGTIEIADLEKEKARMAAVEFVLFHTGWDRRWGRPEYFDPFPVLSAEAAVWLAGFKLKGVGVDAISVDEIGSTALPVHRTLMAAGFILIENLTSLDALIGKDFVFSCLPLKIAGGDGSPVRAAAFF